MSAAVSARTPACQEWIRLRVFRGHPALGVVGVALGADRRAEHDRAAGCLLPIADSGHEPDRPPVGLGEIVERVAELRAPGGVRAPGVRLEHEADAVTARNLEVRLEVALHRRPPLVPLEERERGEAWEIEPVDEDQRRLHASVREQHAAVQLGQRLAVAHRAKRMPRPIGMQRAAPPYTRVMREHDLELLELPAVLARLAAAAASEPGALLAGGLRPSADADEVRLRQQQTSEAIALLDEAGGARSRRCRGRDARRPSTPRAAARSTPGASSLVERDDPGRCRRTPLARRRGTTCPR